MTKTFKHSGTLGDIVYGLPIMKHYGGGEFYLHLEQIDWITGHYYGHEPDPYHRGRMTMKDAEFMQEFMLAQEYVTGFNVLDPANTPITHNLDRFRPLFVYHPANYVTTYCKAFNISDQTVVSRLNTEPWITVPSPRPVPGKPFVINRTLRGFAPPGCHAQWHTWREQGIDQKSVFVGLPDEYTAFCDLTGWNLEYLPTKDMLELAEVIAGCERFMGNQSVALSIAQGLGVPYAYETRRDLPMERNESYFPDHQHGSYF